ncbi:CAP domain-containing protein [Allobacillus halotolerans]|uniref:CAP domain-containing protein n=1 Tax=Allobacillus halotolerans TaxID=570278 RepID=UPI002365F264|nr:CAP domain-containing protein [Allobacillus halotolerans]
MKKLSVILFAIILFCVGCGQEEESIDFQFEPDPVSFDGDGDQERPRTSRWANDGDPNSIQNPDYPLGTKERERPNERNRRGFESEIDPRPGIGSPEKRDGDSIKTPSQLDDLLEEVVELTNREREVNGLPALEIDKELQDVAQEKSADMAELNYFSHESPTYGSPFDMLDEFEIEYKVAAENIAAGFFDPEDVVNGWMKSEGHRKNILDENVTHIGVGYEEGGEMETYWTQLFIAK